LQIVSLGFPQLDSDIRTFYGVFHHVGAAVVRKNAKLTADWMTILNELTANLTGQEAQYDAEVRVQSKRAVLRFLFHTLTHPSTCRLECDCPKIPCPLFTLRMFWKSSSVMRMFERLMVDPEAGFRVLGMRVLWQWFRLCFILPTCRRFESLRLSEDQLIGAPFVVSCFRTVCSNGLDATSGSALLGMLAGNLIVAPVNTESQLDSQVSLMGHKLANPLILGPIFTALQKTDYAGRLENLKNFLSLFVAKEFASELFLLSPRWQMWLFGLLTDVPDADEGSATPVTPDQRADMRRRKAIRIQRVEDEKNANKLVYKSILDLKAEHLSPSQAAATGSSPSAAESKRIGRLTISPMCAFMLPDVVNYTDVVPRPWVKLTVARKVYCTEPLKVCTPDPIWSDVFRIDNCADDV